MGRDVVVVQQPRAHAGDQRGWPRSASLVAALGAVALVACGCSAAPPTRQPTTSGPAPQLTIWLTGYSWQDNTPPGSSKVGEPVLHHEAGGQGTFADPITVAVPGHEGDMAWPPGTKFYLPTVKRYVIVEDSGAAKAPAGTDTHLDMWIDGQDGTKQATDECENQLTGTVPAQVNPPDGLPVMAGPVYASDTCNIPPQSADMGSYRDSGGDNGGGGGPHRNASASGDGGGDNGDDN